MRDRRGAPEGASNPGKVTPARIPGSTVVGGGRRQCPSGSDFERGSNIKMKMRMMMKTQSLTSNQESGVRGALRRSYSQLSTLNTQLATPRLLPPLPDATVASSL
jgi:hypothetical protein